MSSELFDLGFSIPAPDPIDGQLAEIVDGVSAVKSVLRARLDGAAGSISGGLAAVKNDLENQIKGLLLDGHDSLATVYNEIATQQMAAEAARQEGEFAGRNVVSGRPLGGSPLGAVYYPTVPAAGLFSTLLPPSGP